MRGFRKGRCGAQQMWQWIYDLLVWLKIFRKNARLLFLGLDNAGKTTLMRMLRDDRSALHEPTQRPTHETFTVGNVTCEVIDMGGHQAVRSMWTDYLHQEVDGIVFVVDAADSGRFAEARTELNALLTSEAARDLPVLVIGNKIDLPIAASESVLREALFLQNTVGKAVPVASVPAGQRVIELFMCSVINRAGFAHAFKWLFAFLE